MKDRFFKFSHTRTGRGLLLALAYLGIFLVLTWPLLRLFPGHTMSGFEDGSMSLWNLWWMKYSIFDLHQSPLHTGYLYYPDGVSLVFHSIPKVLGLASVPFQYLFGIIISLNIIFMLTFVLTALAVYWLAYHLTGQRLPAFLAGAFFAFASPRWIHTGHLQLLAAMFIPVYMVLLVRGREALWAGGRWGSRRAWTLFALAGAAMALQAYDTEYYAVFLMIFTVLYAVFYFPFLAVVRGTLGRGAGLTEPLRRWALMIAGMSLSAVAFVVLFSPMLIAASRESGMKGDYFTFPVAWAVSYSADLLSFITPHANSQYLWSRFASLATKFPLTDVTFLGWLAVLLAVVGVARYWRRRDIWLWVTTVLLFGALSLGPNILIAGKQTGVPGPYVWLAKVPVVNSVRVPARFVEMIMLGVVILAAYGAMALFGFLRRKGWGKLGVPVLAAFILLDVFGEYKPFHPISDRVPPPAYEEIARSDEPGTVISLPLGWEGGGDLTGMEETWMEQFQSLHKRPLVGGMVARAPKEQIYRGIYTPVLDFLADPVNLAPSDLDRDPAAIARFYEKYQPAFIVVHKVTPLLLNEGVWYHYPSMLTPQSLEKLDGYITGYLGMEKFADTDDLIAFRKR